MPRQAARQHMQRRALDRDSAADIEYKEWQCACAFRRPAVTMFHGHCLRHAFAMLRVLPILRRCRRCCRVSLPPCRHVATAFMPCRRAIISSMRH